MTDPMPEALGGRSGWWGAVKPPKYVPEKPHSVGLISGTGIAIGGILLYRGGAAELRLPPLPYHRTCETASGDRSHLVLTLEV